MGNSSIDFYTEDVWPLSSTLSFLLYILRVTSIMLLTLETTTQRLGEENLLQIFFRTPKNAKFLNMRLSKTASFFLIFFKKLNYESRRQANVKWYFTLPLKYWESTFNNLFISAIIATFLVSHDQSITSSGWTFLFQCNEWIDDH